MRSGTIRFFIRKRRCIEAASPVYASCCISSRIPRLTKKSFCEDKLTSSRPQATPASIIDTLRQEVVAALATREVRDYMASASVEIVGSTPAEFSAFFRAERDRWARVVRETGAKVD